MKKYTVSFYSYVDNYPTASDDFEFETLEEAKRFFDEHDVKADWMTERNTDSATHAVHKSFVAEISRPKDDFCFEVLEYKEYGYRDYVRETL